VSPSTLSIQAAALSDCGMHRPINEDSWVCDTQLGLYAIADGMGGHGAGDLASEIATTTIRTIYEQACESETASDVTDLVCSAVERANSAVFNANQSVDIEPGNGMGTTLVGLYAPTPETDDAPSCGIVFNVGDSRLYRFRDNQLTQITEDHTLLREWQLSNEAGPAPPGNIIIRAIGLFESVDCDITPISLQRDDLILICSDGLSDMLSETELIDLLEAGKSGPMEDLCDGLVRRANRNGGIDNITALTLHVV